MADQPPNYGTIDAQTAQHPSGPNPPYPTGPMDGSPYPPAGAVGVAPPQQPYSYPQPGDQPVQYPVEPPPAYETPKAHQQYPPPGAFPQQAGNPPHGYQVVQQQPTQTVIVAQSITLGPHPQTLVCPCCQAMVTTRVTYQSGGMTWLAAGLLCLFGCWLGCCLIPFCISDLQDVHHSCPNCGRVLGIHGRL